MKRVDVSRVPVGELASVCGTFAERLKFGLTASVVGEQVVLEVDSLG